MQNYIFELFILHFNTRGVISVELPHTTTAGASSTRTGSSCSAAACRFPANVHKAFHQTYITNNFPSFFSPLSNSASSSSSRTGTSTTSFRRTTSSSDRSGTRRGRRLQKYKTKRILRSNRHCFQYVWITMKHWLTIFRVWENRP